MITPAAVVPLFLVLWVALGAGGFFFFAFNKDVARKRLYFPRYVIGAGVLFGLVIALMAPVPAVILFLPFIALITWANLRMTRFCDCGKLLINQQWWVRMKFCPYCGEKLAE